MNAEAGWSFYDISQPDKPRELGFLSTRKGGVVNLIFITDGNGGGLTVLRYTGPIPAGPPIPGAR
jgi:hypothetical protein